MSSFGLNALQDRTNSSSAIEAMRREKVAAHDATKEAAIREDTAASAMDADATTFLTQAGLGAYAAKLADFGAATLAALNDPELADEDLLSADIGMKKLQVKKFRRALASSAGGAAAAGAAAAATAAGGAPVADDAAAANAAREAAAAAQKAAAAKQRKLNPEEAARRDAALLAAAKNSDVAAIEAALRGCADVDAKDEDGFTALMYAVTKAEDDADAVDALVRGGADVYAKIEEMGVTALMMAAHYGHVDAAAALLKAGADRAAKGIAGLVAGKTALEIATEEGNEAVAALLR